MVIVCCLSLANRPGNAQRGTEAPPGGASTTLTSDTATVRHFFAAHGERALIDGYSSDSLEVWIYPFQVLRGYKVWFREAGASTALDARDFLSRVVYGPNTITRIYIGSDFVVREKLMVPDEKAGAVINYTLQSARPLEIVAHATPVLNLMWPGALGGQNVSWNGSLNAFVLSEPLHGFTAVVGSPDISEHDEIVNQTTQGAEGAQLEFTLQPNAQGVANVFVALNPAHAQDPGAELRSMMGNRDRMDTDAAANLDAFRKEVILLKTPDEEVNRAFALSEIALKQAWVCDDGIGCGFFAGYGPTRAERRPQYDWFFAGDGLISAGGALSDGDRRHARDELEFILHYQDKKSGMIWHELSQSAAFIDWAGKYPYMFVHVDVTFQFLGAVGRYVRSTGDVDFARGHWEELAAAFNYCRSLIDPATALPKIPADKEGGNEQDRMSDDLGLSTSWVSAAGAVAQLATLTGHKQLANEAVFAAQAARTAFRFVTGTRSNHFGSMATIRQINPCANAGAALAKPLRCGYSVMSSVALCSMNWRRRRFRPIGVRGVSRPARKDMTPDRMRRAVCGHWARLPWPVRSGRNIGPLLHSVCGVRWFPWHRWIRWVMCTRCSRVICPCPNRVCP
jgi:hypothetical protein